MQIIRKKYNWASPLFKRNKTNRIILHHAQAKTCSVEDIHQWHLKKDWSGIGYHFLVRKDGTIYQGRPEDTIGAHAKGANHDSIGICAEGDFMKEEDIVDLPLYDLFKFLAAKNAGEVLIIRGIFTKAQDAMLSSADKFLKKLSEESEKENYEVNLSMAIQCYAQALFIGEKIELCDKVSYDLTPECFKGVDN